MKQIFFILGFLFIIFLMYTSGKSEYDLQIDEQNHYCEMVKLFKDSKGKTGWPDFKNTYSEWCIKKPVKKQA